MAKLIEFYVPTSFKPKARFVASAKRGIVIVFPSDMKKSA